MDHFKGKLFSQSSINAVVLTGILSFLMHPFVLFGYHFPDLGFFSWFYLVPLLVGVHRRKFWHKFILIFLAGLIGHYGIFYWMMTAMQNYGGLNFFEGLATMTLAFVILSFLFAVFMSLACWINHFIKVPLFLLVPIFLVTRDWLLHVIPFGGFPWGIAPYTQGEWIQFFQWVDVTGVLGLSFFIYLINGLVADGFLLLIHRKQVDKMVSRLLVVFVLFLMSLYLSFLSSQTFEKNKVTKGSLNVALVQANIAQDAKWDPYQAQDHLNAHLKLTNAAVKDRADVVIWPETSYPYSIRQNKIKEETFLDKTQLMAPILFGALVSKRQDGASEMFNAVIYTDTKAKFKGVYKKKHLVPFGEYLPLKQYFNYLKGLTQGVGELSAGSKSPLFDIDGINFGSLICFEDIFPVLAQHYSNEGADVLVNYTNDAWYGNTSAQYQHLVFSQFRALESRRFLVRASNTGVTAIINPKGEILESIEPFTKGYLLRSLKIDTMQSYFMIYGHSWVQFVAMLCGLIFIYSIVKCRLGPVKLEF